MDDKKTSSANATATISDFGESESNSVHRNVATMLKHGGSAAEVAILKEAAAELYARGSGAQSSPPSPTTLQHNAESVHLLRRDLDALFQKS